MSRWFPFTNGQQCRALILLNKRSSCRNLRRYYVSTRDVTVIILQMPGCVTGQWIALTEPTSATVNKPVGDPISWWRHQREKFSALLAFVRGIHRSPVNSPHKGPWHGALVFLWNAPLCGEFTCYWWIPHTKVRDTELWCFFDLRLNKRLSKQSRG